MKAVRGRLWSQAGMGLAWKGWMENAFNADPDHHRGSPERRIAGAAVVTTLINFAAARVEWRRAATAAAGAAA